MQPRKVCLYEFKKALQGIVHNDKKSHKKKYFLCEIVCSLEREKVAILLYGGGRHNGLSEIKK